MTMRSVFTQFRRKFATRVRLYTLLGFRFPKLRALR